ncbi:MAG: hypothetical protein OMM_14094 [Candidatus Magnetoglobus multicellularis str. Araruama]|uniref:HepT-like domain-containing protein n=1 Tax=Candidatus Magnetoglobus multicellularis str. Araruama TaxID=890399 RepID=A0A1V1NSI1_9BACT|nr:MAG: hypothetical protein OMM_14094 [Candidatus Magnetoglobus multicellularis str. Araruama]
MNYDSLIERIRLEIPLLDQVTQKAIDAWNKGAKSPDNQEIYIGYVALNLHGFYSGLEKIFILTARQIDGEVPKGKDWHSKLIEQISKENKDIRPAIIGTKSAELLDEFKRFRHVVRNVYTFSLAPEKIGPLIRELPVLWKQIRVELIDFSRFLEAIN